jgi:hypothetical protein
MHVKIPVSSFSSGIEKPVKTETKIYWLKPDMEIVAGDIDFGLH